ncbi:MULTISPECIES: type II secretion system protein [unclassified Desulfurobacterium]|uniref:type II secretion system protein n=1 Tax=Desulfurobacterium sp. TC5-1 TaxID=1158318 RepID=UPI0003B76580|nr:prepilin-type N-terminal cleavage/methylation domain-containing protein [Desulfurobacterium sp. TC5-1]
MRKGFTLLEVLVGVTIFAVAASALIFVSSKNVERLGNAEDVVKGLYIVKSRIYGLSGKGRGDGFSVEEKEKDLNYGVVERIFKVKKGEKNLFTFYYYEKR